ncbi:hypothetical protein VTJ83DRAFT_3438 [Remersonia thermophila]|uniref:3'-5' exonuclease domain-containing protein n=1 Tax=Remersonia thermophila TaxID=72144 RepID=A0ABR4DG66_9PEZI
MRGTGSFCICRRRSRSSLAPLSSLPTRARHLLSRQGGAERMASRKPVHQVWHVSRGIVFSGGTTVVYPRLPPPARCYSPSAAAAAVSEEPGPASMPTVPSSPSPAAAVSAAHEPPAAVKSEVVTALLETRTVAAASVSNATVTASSSTITSTTAVLVEEAERKDGPSAAKKPVDKPNPEKTAPVVPPYTPLDYKIPDKAFQNARNAPPGSPQSFWNYSLYRGPSETGALDAKVKVHYCTSSRTTERVVKEHFSHEKVLGFDLEWMSNANRYSGPRKNVSLIQLASPSRIGLFHVAAFPRNDTLVPPALRALLEDPGITKVGCWIKGDCTRVANHLDVRVRGQLEISHLYKLVKYSQTGEYGQINKKLVRLAAQVEECLGLPLSKEVDVRMSDWSKPLNMAQILYSSSDVYASVQLYHVLNHHRQQLALVPPLPHHAELDLPIPFVVQPSPEKPEAAAKAAAKSGQDGQAQAVTDAGVPQEGSASGAPSVAAAPSVPAEEHVAPNEIDPAAGTGLTNLAE